MLISLKLYLFVWWFNVVFTICLFVWWVEIVLTICLWNLMLWGFFWIIWWVKIVLKICLWGVLIEDIFEYFRASLSICSSIRFRFGLIWFCGFGCFFLFACSSLFTMILVVFFFFYKLSMLLVVASWVWSEVLDNKLLDLCY